VFYFQAALRTYRDVLAAAYDFGGNDENSFNEQRQTMQTPSTV